MRNVFAISLTIGFTVLLLASCTMAPDYQRPDTPVETAWPQGPAYKTPASIDDKADAPAVPVELAWRTFFRSTPLQKIIEQTLTHNRDMRIAALNVEAARAAYRIQRADLVPNVSATAAASRQGIPENASQTGVDQTIGQYTANAALTAFEVDLFGRVRSLNQSALERYLATGQARDATQIALIAEVANAYLTLLADMKLLSLTEETLVTQIESHSVIKRSFDMGIGSQLDVSQAETTVEAARANHAMYQRRVAQAKNALTLLMGTVPDEKLFMTETLDAVALHEELDAGIPSEILLRRPDVAQAEHVLRAANANIGAARAAFFPRITLTGTLGIASSDMSSLFSSGSGLAWSFVPQATLPIFEGGRNVANLDQATVERDIAVASYEKSIQVAFREVADQLAARGTFTDQLKAQQNLVAAAQRAYDISQARYKQGIDNHLSVLDAQRALYAAQQNEILVQQQRLSNLVNLYKVLGGGIR